MAHAENQATINRPPEEVYAFLADGLNNPRLAVGSPGHFAQKRRGRSGWGLSLPKPSL